MPRPKTELTDEIREALAVLGGLRDAAEARRAAAAAECAREHDAADADVARAASEAMTAGATAAMVGDVLDVHPKTVFRMLRRMRAAS